MNDTNVHTSSTHRGGPESIAAARHRWGRALCRSTAAIDRSGITPLLALQALLLTLMTYAVANTWLLWKIDGAYHGSALAWLGNVPADERIERLCELVRAKRSLKSHSLLQSVFQSDAPSSQQLAQLIDGIASSSDGDTARRARMRTWILGNVSGWRFLVLSADPITGTELIQRIEREDAAWKHKLDGQKDQAADLREFLVGFSDLVIQQTRPAIRNLQRINGWIQWLTVYVTWIVLVAAAQRAFMLATLDAKGWFAPRSGDALRVSVAHRLFDRVLGWTQKGRDGSAAGHAAGDGAGAQGQIPPLYDGATQATEFLGQHQLPELLDRQVYGPYSFLLGLLPSLGFIGTVYGMGDALLSADGLFQAQDKGAAISEITTHLGFAFDTTLVALLAGIVASAIVVRLRVWENHLWQLAERSQPT
jgi:hypothetical protein